MYILSSWGIGMIENANFLCEIGTEEIPAGYCAPAMEALQKAFGEKLHEKRIAYTDIDVCATPRRIALFVSGMADAQSEEEVEIKGPSTKAAYDAQGNPTKALDGFLKGNAVKREDVFTVRTDKGEYVYARKRMTAGRTEDILPSILDEVIKGLPFPKRMRWSDKSISFPRPISYFMILFNDRIVPFKMDGIASSNTTRGHYIRFNRMIRIDRIQEYESALKDNGVVINQHERKKIIKDELLKAAASIGGTLVHDEELVNTVTFLAESPYAVICEFDRDFLKIPDIVLITEMKEHQKYFAVRDKDGSLMPYFLVISNNPPTEYIRKGNERVITARFNDARFFFEEDRKTALYEKVESLKSVLFHKDLGSIFDKVERVKAVASVISDELGLDDAVRNKITRAATLCKADLNTAMVFEFTSLQGKIGKIYAMLDGEDPDVASAIDDHYKPRFQDDPLPSGIVSVALSLAEKIDNLLGSYSVGNIPKGSQDPYALRRQANAVVDLVLNTNLRLDMRRVLEKSAAHYTNGEALIDRILDFITARANTIFSEHGFRYDEIDACLSTGYYDFRELFLRAQSVHEFRKNTNFGEMLLSFKRMNNIVSAFKQKNKDYSLTFNASLLQEEAERDLHAFFDSRRGEISGYIASNSYQKLFELLIEGKAIIDRFFDAVMVMVDNIQIRDNRLALLDAILNPFTNLIDFSKIAE